ncbi:ABC transporter [Psychrobacillus sp. NEAU-3TGS]|uniref:ABC transporter n=1 Tax=Psychrobacillus sp. NEAU-3TGS TaxID=2995412 RepID=UPI0024960037|nr:ABC transporter [Psychrobacillus sp. NEAU-3TGS]MDI2585813.1 ABC transporter [Psychrobacillus sp. NEAU-3TGS]
MWKVLKTFFILEKSNKKNMFACMIVAAFVFGLIFFVKTEDLGNSLKEKSGEYQSLSVALNKFQNVDATDNGNGSDLYKNLVVQQQLIAKQRMAVKVDRPEWFLDTALEVVNLRASAFAMDGFDKVASNLPTKTENQLESVFYEHIKKTEVPLSLDSLSFFPFLAYLFGVLGFLWFIFMSIYSCGIMVEDFRHTSLIKGYPITFDKYVIAKCISSMLLVVVFLLELFVCSLPLIYFKGLGDPTYPIAIFNGTFDIYPIYKYIGLALLYMICISIFTILLSVILNVLLKNMYLTLFLELLLFVFPMLFPSMMNFLPFNPFNYMNFSSVLNGQTLDLANPVFLNSIHGLMYIGLSIILMIATVKLFLTTGKLKRV